MYLMPLLFVVVLRHLARIFAAYFTTATEAQHEVRESSHIFQHEMGCSLPDDRYSFANEKLLITDPPRFFSYE